MNSLSFVIHTCSVAAASVLAMSLFLLLLWLEWVCPTWDCGYPCVLDIPKREGAPVVISIPSVAQSSSSFIDLICSWQSTQVQESSNLFPLKLNTPQKPLYWDPFRQCLILGPSGGWHWYVHPLKQPYAEPYSAAETKDSRPIERHKLSGTDWLINDGQRQQPPPPCPGSTPKWALQGSAPVWLSLSRNAPVGLSGMTGQAMLDKMIRNHGGS